jgi:hypothetical protein
MCSHAADWQSVLRPRPNEAFSIRHFGSRRKSKVIRAIDYNSLVDLLRDSCNVLNSGGGLLPTATAAVWACSSRLLSDRQQRQVASDPQIEAIFTVKFSNENGREVEAVVAE